MTESLAELSKGALSDLAGVFAAMPEDAFEGLIEAIVAAKRIVVFGLGREGLQMRGFAMRLFHMGRDVAVWGDMTTPALGPGDLFIVSAGPGDLQTARTLVDVARKRAPARRLSPPSPRRAHQARRRRDRDPRPDDGRRSRRFALGAADGLAVRDRANDRLRARDPETAPPLPARPRRRCARGTPIWSDSGRAPFDVNPSSGAVTVVRRAFFRMPMRHVLSKGRKVDC